MEGFVDEMLSVEPGGDEDLDSVAVAMGNMVLMYMNSQYL